MSECPGGLKELPVALRERFVPVQVFGKRTGIEPHLLSLRWVLEHPANSLRKGLIITNGDEKSGHTISDQLGDPSHTAGYDRCGRGHGLQYDPW